MSLANIHVISKENIRQHLVVSLSKSALSPLREGHVRMRTAIISLTNNNGSYALLGSLRNWWDAYPVPDSLPTPYNDQTQYGICPAWGYGEVLESRTRGIDTGTLIWGFWPTTDFPVDLRLVPAEVEGQWIETSEGRKELMNLYKQYSVPHPEERLVALDRARIEEMAWEAALVVWSAGYLLNDAVFGSPPIHPLGIGDWDENDADLSSAVVVSLSSSGKTARSFTHGLINHRPDSQKPFGLLAITSNLNSSVIPEAAFPTLTVPYEAIADSDTLSWIARQKPKKVVLVDFGGRGNSLHNLLRALEESFKEAKTVIIGVGGSVENATQHQLGIWAQKNLSLENRVQMNTSGIKDAAVAKLGAGPFFKRLEDAWCSFRTSASISDLKLEWGEGLAGPSGFEGGWTKLCEGKTASKNALVYRF